MTKNRHERRANKEPRAAIKKPITLTISEVNLTYASNFARERELNFSDAMSLLINQFFNEYKNGETVQ